MFDHAKSIVISPTKRAAPRFRVWDALWLWVLCLKAGGRCQHDMTALGHRCRNPKGHDGPHVSWRTGIPFLDPTR